MVICGIVTDRVGRIDTSRKWTAAIVFCMISLVFLTVGFRVGTGAAQMVLVGIGAFFSGGASGPSAAMVANLTHSSVRASAMGTLAVAYNLLGMALGPFVVGILADRLGLLAALQLSPLVYLGAIAALVAGKRLYPAGVRKLAALSTETPRP
jgi:MFS family permease